MTRKKKPLPQFQSEREEGQWYRQHRDELDDYFDPVAESANAIPLAQELNLPSRKRPPSQKVPLRIPVGDLERARALADKKGIGYQTLLKMLIHEGLEREEEHYSLNQAARPKAAGKMLKHHKA